MPGDAEPRARAGQTLISSGFTFGTTRHMNEAANGTWSLKIEDKRSSEGTATFTSWQITFYGR